MTLLSPSDLLKIEEHLGTSLDRMLHTGTPLPAHLRPLIQRLNAYVVRGGKRLRPQLCVWAYQCNSDDPIDSPVLDVACAWEIFHAFLLVHDDLIDVADTRRQTPSLHRQLQKLDHDSPLFGQNLAIVGGDLLFSAAIRLLAEMQIGPATSVKLIRLFSRIACTTGFGQAIDLFQAQMPLQGVSEELLLREYDWKTAAYTFEGPLLSGAILAGVDDSAFESLSKISRVIGQAYQLHNDLVDLSTPAHEGCDLVQGKRTISLMRARARMSDEHRLWFDQQIESLASANGRAVRQAESLRQELCGFGVMQQTQDFIDALLEQARQVAGCGEIPCRFSKGLVQLVDSLALRYFVVPGASLQSPVNG